MGTVIAKMNHLLLIVGSHRHRAWVSMWNILEAATERVAALWLMRGNSLGCADTCLWLANLICAALTSAPVVRVRDRTEHFKNRCKCLHGVTATPVSL